MIKPYVPRVTRLLQSGAKFCSKCIYDSTVPKITFDEQGVCSYCKMIEDIDKQFKAATPEGEKEFDAICEQIKKDGKEKKYDCVIGVSGGTDSSYLVWLAIQKGVRP